MIMFPHNWATEIVELVETLLDKYDIFVPSPEDDERDWPENQAKLYGSTYADILDPVEGCLRSFQEETEEEIFAEIIGIFNGEIGDYLDPVSEEDKAKMEQDIREEIHKFVVRVNWISEAGGEVDEDGLYGNDDYDGEIPPDIIAKGVVPCGLYSLDMLPDEDGVWQENERQFVGRINVKLRGTDAIALAPKDVVKAIASTTITMGVKKAPALTTTDLRRLYVNDMGDLGCWLEIGLKKGGKPLYGVKVSEEFFAPWM